MTFKKRIILKSLMLTIFLSACGGSGSGSGTSQVKLVEQTWKLSDSKTPIFSMQTGEIQDFSTIVYDKHPRLYFRDTDVADVKSMAKGADWDDFKATIMKSSRLPKGQETSKALAFLDLAEAGDAEYARMMALVAFIEKDPYYLNLTKAWALHLAAKTPENDDGDILLRRRIERLSEIYDWFHDDLSESEKKSIRAGLLKSVNKLLTFDYMNTTRNYVQKHSRWGDGVVAEAMLSMYGDFDADFTKAYADDLLHKTREYLKKYAQTEKYIAEDGGWHLGWGYAYYNANYTFNYLVWTTATKETMLDDWLGDMSDWYLYALRADKTLPQMGDATISTLGFGTLANLYQAKYKNDDVAKWYLNEIQHSQSRYQNQFMQFLFQNDLSSKKTPDQGRKALSRYFERPGVVIARDTWDFDNATLMVFKSSPFYNAGHHHRDENAFTIDYKTSLALDTGYYDQTDSPHYKNYYVRTIAHNAITVFNPAQKMYYYTDYNGKDSLQNKLLANDGGQVYKDPDSLSKKDIVEGAPNRLDGITKYHMAKGYTYTQGDATKAYDSATVTLAKRDIVYTKDAGFAHPAIVVLDRVEATSGNFKKRYLLHMQADAGTLPVIAANSMKVESARFDAQGAKIATTKMTNITLYPKDATLSLVGGAGHEFDLYPESGVVNTLPQDNPSTRAINEDPNTKVGDYRLEVSPTLGKKYDVMLNVILVDDASRADVSIFDVQLLDGADTIGVQLPKHTLVFSKEKRAPKAAMTYTMVQNVLNMRQSVFTGYAQGVTLKVYKNGVAIQSVVVSKEGCVDFNLSANAGDTIRVAP